MFELESLVRKNIKSLEPYSSARSEYTDRKGIFLDANENPFGIFNRYPDPYQKELRARLGELNKVPAEHIFIGNGSDEIIDLVFRIFCTPGSDKAMTFNPTYGMYKVAAAMNDIELIEAHLNESFQIDWEEMDRLIIDNKPKVIFVCSPNNPTGNLIERVDDLLGRFHGIVVLDEAYIDFASNHSYIRSLKKYPNLIVTQTLSKAWGLAGARIGIAYASAAIISFFLRVKPPYNVSQLNQNAAMEALSDLERYSQRMALILEQKAWLVVQFSRIPLIKRVFPSDCNFLLLETVNAAYVYEELKQRNIIVRNRHKDFVNSIRITVGSPSENQQLIQALKDIKPLAN